MMAALTRGLCAALALGVGIGAWLAPGGLLQALWIGVALFVAVKLAVTSLNFVVAAHANGDDPVGFRLPPMRLAYGFCEESWCTTRSLLVHLPWSVRAALPAPTAPRANCLPVLMIHGFVCNRGYWVPAARQLIAQGYVVDALTLEPAFGSIDDYPPLIARAVDALKIKTNASQVVLVCHSMGGLAARAYLRDYGVAHVAHVITLGTPHHGTALAQFAVSPNGRQMRRDSPWLRALAASEPQGAYAQFTTIYSRIDNIVAPARTAVLTGAKEIELDDVGHVALAFAPRGLHALQEEIARVAQR